MELNEIGALLERIQALVGVRASVVVDTALVRPADASILERIMDRGID